MHRKANRTDIEEMLQLKADESEIKTLHQLLSQKAEMQHIDDVFR